MKKLIIIFSLVVVVLAGCVPSQPKPEKCWQTAYTGAAFPDVIVIYNVCTGEIRTTVIEPIKKYIEKIDKRNEKRRKAAERKKSFKGSA